MKLSDPSTGDDVGTLRCPSWRAHGVILRVARTRLRIIHCSTCIRGYCFAFRAHTDPGRRQHKMEMFEPRIVHEAESRKIINFSFGLAQQASHDLKCLVEIHAVKGNYSSVSKRRRKWLPNLKPRKRHDVEPF